VSNHIEICYCYVGHIYTSSNPRLIIMRKFYVVFDYSSTLDKQ